MLFGWFAFKRFRRITRDVACLQISTANDSAARRQNSWICLLFLLLLRSPFHQPEIRFVTVSCFDFAIMKLLRARLVVVAPGFSSERVVGSVGAR